ncbi:hypothetical protein ACQY0O_004555 [Thecaphora frezii]
MAQAQYSQVTPVTPPSISRPLAPTGSAAGPRLPSLARLEFSERAASVPRMDSTRWSHSPEHGFRPMLSACPSPTMSSCSSTFSTASHVELRVAGREARSRTNKSGFTRSRTGCLTCRSQKKKCDELKPICTRCKNNQHNCRYPDQNLSSSRCVVKEQQRSAYQQPFGYSPQPQALRHQPYPTYRSEQPHVSVAVAAASSPRYGLGEAQAPPRFWSHHPTRSISAPSVRTMPTVHSASQEAERRPAPSVHFGDDTIVAGYPLRKLPPLPPIQAPATRSNPILSSVSVAPLDGRRSASSPLPTCLESFRLPSPRLHPPEGKVTLPPISAFDRPVWLAAPRMA